jgi:glutaredoxin
MSEQLFKMDEDMVDDMNITQPIPYGVTIYSKSNCWRCKFIKECIKQLYPAYMTVNCDVYIDDNVDLFKSRMFEMMKHKPDDNKLRFPVVFVDGYYVSNFEAHIIEGKM